MESKRVRFFIDALRREARSGGEVLKCLEVFERAVDEEDAQRHGFITTRPLTEDEEHLVEGVRALFYAFEFLGRRYGYAISLERSEKTGGLSVAMTRISDACSEHRLLRCAVCKQFGLDVELSLIPGRARCSLCGSVNDVDEALEVTPVPMGAVP